MSPEEKPLNYERQQETRNTNISWKEIIYQYFKEILALIIILLLFILILCTYDKIDKTILGAMATGIVGSIGYLLGKKSNT